MYNFFLPNISGAKKHKNQPISSYSTAMKSPNFGLSNTTALTPELHPPGHFQLTEGVNTKRQCPRITEYIKDRTLRIKSYFRRRHVPFKRAFDMNLQCGTSSLLIQISDDIEECLYFGDDRLVERFLDPMQGLRLSHVHQIIQHGKY